MFIRNGFIGDIKRILFNKKTIYRSEFHFNTKKYKNNGWILNAKFLDVENVDINLIGEYDLIGFGSGIFYGKPKKKLWNILKV